MRVSNAAQSARTSRRTRTIAASIVAAGLWWSGAATSQAAAATNRPAGTAPDPASAESSLRIQAQELAGQIQAEGIHLDQLAATYEATQLRSQQLAGRLRILQARMVQTDGQVTAARATLKEQAIVSYVAGGAPVTRQMPGQPGLDRTLTVSYAEIVSGGQQRAVNAYRAVLATQTAESQQLTADHQQAVATMAELQTDQNAAEQVIAQRQQTLTQVRGQLATLVAQVQQAQAQAEQAAVRESLARQEQLPAGPPVGATASSGPERPVQPKRDGRIDQRQRHEHQRASPVDRRAGLWDRRGCHHPVGPARDPGHAGDDPARPAGDPSGGAGDDPAAPARRRRR